MTWKVCGDINLPLADRDREWDGSAAEERIFRSADWDGEPDQKRAREAFFAYDDESPLNKTAYKLPFVDVIDGRLYAIPRGIFAVAQVLEGGRGGVDLPRSLIARIRRKVAVYYHKMGEEPPWKSSSEHEQPKEKVAA